MYRSYSVNNMPEPVRYTNIPPPKPKQKPAEKKKETDIKPSTQQKCAPKREGILSNLQTDDIILGIVVLALLIDDCDDTVLLIALLLVLFSDYFNF